MGEQGSIGAATPGPAAPEALALLAFELSQSRLDTQEAVLEELRSRAGVLLAASSLAASFLGQEAFSDAGWGVLPILAVAAFLVSMAASVYVLLPTSGFVFSVVGPLYSSGSTQSRED